MNPDVATHPKDQLDPSGLIHTYIRAKDENRPHLMTRAFAHDAVLQMTVKSDAISFPARSEGRAAVTDVLVRRFGQTYDNVYTFCLTDTPPNRDADTFRCDWLVGMTDKDSGNVRVGCGSYRWAFTGMPHARLVQSLEIVIEAMEVLPAETAPLIIDGWLARLTYPWATARQACSAAPALSALAPVLAYLQQPEH